jgi:pimeloyl-ACP methyl ester carboxylesterase
MTASPARPIPSIARDLAARAIVTETDCGKGGMVWRRWGELSHPRHVVLCHGGAGSWTHWIKTLPALQGTCCVWAPDLPGLGDSPMPDSISPEGCAEAVAAGILAQIPAGARLQIVGFSWGAHIATLASTLLGSRVEGLTIVGCAAVGLPQPQFEFAREHAGMSDAERQAVHRATLHMLMIKDPTRIDQLALDLQAENVRRARFRSRPYATSDGIARALPFVTAQLTAIWGQDDQIALPSVAARLAVLRLNHPELVAEVIPDAGHWVMYEQAAAFNTALLRLIKLR